MSDTKEQRNNWLWRGAFVLFVAALFVVPEIRRMMKPQGELAHPWIECYAAAVALDQHLHADFADNPADMPEFEPAFRDVFAELNDRARGYRRRDDPALPLFRPLIERAEIARDEAVAIDPVTYRTTAWAEVQRCHFGESDAEEES